MSKTLSTSCVSSQVFSEQSREFSMPKLSVIWDKAARELKQIRRSYGHAGRKEACALGAIVYYASNGHTCNPSKIPISQRLIYANVVAKWERLSGWEISRLNDKEGWTFERLAENARELGC
jgi:hypothetical protein